MLKHSVQPAYYAIQTRRNAISLYRNLRTSKHPLRKRHKCYLIYEGLCQNSPLHNGCRFIFSNITMTVVILCLWRFRMLVSFGAIPWRHFSGRTHITRLSTTTLPSVHVVSDDDRCFPGSCHPFPCFPPMLEKIEHGIRCIVSQSGFHDPPLLARALNRCSLVYALSHRSMQQARGVFSPSVGRSLSTLPVFGSCWLVIEFIEFIRFPPKINYKLKSIYTLA